MPSPMTDDRKFDELLMDSYRRSVGEALVPAEYGTQAEAVRWLYQEAPFCVLAHDLSPDPVFVYVNKSTQRAFEYSQDEFIGMPSRLSAGPPDRSERQELMDAVRAQGFVTGYRGLRVAKSGRQFWIEDVTIWNIVDEKRVRHGQAALIRRCVDA